MAIRQIRIGSMDNIHQYDDADFTEAANFDGQPIIIGASTAADEAVRQDQIPALGNIVSASANITDNAIVRGDGGARGIQDSLVTIDDSGTVNIPTGQSYSVAGTQVVTNQQAAESDVAAVPDLTGADTIDQSGLETYLGNLRTTINNLLTKLRTHGLIDT